MRFYQMFLFGRREEKMSDGGILFLAFVAMIMLHWINTRFAPIYWYAMTGRKVGYLDTDIKEGREDE